MLEALADHLFILRNTLHGLRDDPAHFKTLASELRVLICLSSGTEGMLWRLADELQVSDFMELNVAESVKRDSPLVKGMMICKLPCSRPGKGDASRPRKSVKLRYVIKHCEAIYVAQISDRKLTHQILIKAVAEQMGGAHEDDGVDVTLARLNNFLVNNRQLFVGVLAFDAELTLQVGERVLDRAEKRNGYRRKRRANDFADVSLCVRVARKSSLLGRVAIVSLSSEISESTITFSVGPRSATFKLTKRNVTIAELSLPYPAVWDDNKDALFTWCYSSSFRKVRTIVNNRANGQTVDVDFGILDARELEIEPHSGYEDFVVARCVPLYSRLLSPDVCSQLLALPADGGELFQLQPAPDGPFPN